MYHLQRKRINRYSQNLIVTSHRVHHCTRHFPVWYKTWITLRRFSSSKPHEKKKESWSILLCQSSRMWGQFPIERTKVQTKYPRPWIPGRPVDGEGLGVWIKSLKWGRIHRKKRCRLPTVLLDSDHLSHRLVRCHLRRVRLQHGKTKDYPHQFCLRAKTERYENAATIFFFFFFPLKIFLETPLRTWPSIASSSLVFGEKKRPPSPRLRCMAWRWRDSCRYFCQRLKAENHLHYCKIQVQVAEIISWWRNGKRPASIWRTQARTGTDPPLFGDLALSLQLGSSLPPLQDTVVLFGVDVQRFLFEHLSPRQRDSLHSGNCAASGNHLNKTKRGNKKNGMKEKKEFLKHVLYAVYICSFCVNSENVCHAQNVWPGILIKRHLTTGRMKLMVP